MTRALVLGGGGARGAFQVGMLLELVGTKGIDFTILHGVGVERPAAVGRCWDRRGRT